MKATAARKPSAKKGPSLMEGGAAALVAASRGALAACSSPAFGRTLLAALVAAGFGAASWRARAHVVEQAAQQIDRRDLAAISLPPFLSDAARADLSALPLPDKISAFHPGLVGTLASELGKIPWIDSVDSLSVDWDGATEDAKLLPRVRFALKIARPIARMEERGLEVLVARSRRRIPLDRVLPSLRSLPRIEGIPQDVSGERVLDDALGLVAALEKDALAARLGLVSVQLAGREATLVLASGVRVEFGPITSIPGLGLEVRVAQLQQFLKAGPPLEQVERISVRWDDPVYVLRPVAPVAVAR